MGWDEVTALATAVAALATAYAAFSAASAAKHSAAVADRDAERWEREQQAQRRARLVGQYMRHGDTTALVIENHGPATATDLRIKVDPELKQYGDGDRLPDSLAPGLVVQLRYHHIPGAANDRKTVLYWRDAAGEEHSLPVPPQLVSASVQKSFRQRQAELRDIAWNL